jgi:hypothetical protein
MGYKNRHMEQFPLVYRSANVVTAKQPFLDWLTQTDPSHGGTLAELRRDAHLYLVPDFEAVADIERAIGKYVKQHYTAIFVHELAAWWLDEAAYPKLTYALFAEWFDVAVHTMVFDLVEGEIEKE